MTKHPLTDEIISKQFGRYDGIDEVMVYDEDDVRAAADWQLAQCLQYILLNHGQDTMVPFMEAMRPTQVASGREGAFQALDRLCEDNYEGLKRLADS